MRKWGVGFLNVNKNPFETLLSCCCFVCAFIVGQYHSGNNMSSKSGAAGETLIFESEKCHEIWPLKTDMLTVSVFNAFIHVHDESKHYHRGDITLHSTYKIDPKYSSVERYVCWNVSWPASAVSVVKNGLSLSRNFTPVAVVHHCIRRQCFILLPNV